MIYHAVKECMLGLHELSPASTGYIFPSTDSETLRFTEFETLENFRVPSLRLPETTPIPNHPGREAHVPHPKWPTCIAQPRFFGTFSGEKAYSDEQKANLSQS
jgi:hypothetical protein